MPSFAMPAPNGERRERSQPRAHSDMNRTSKGSRTTGKQKRAPFADRVPRPVKRTAGRTPGPLTPANIRVDGVRLDEDDRAHIRRKLGEKLGKHQRSIERVTVRVRDVNGPRGGVDVLCRIKVVLSGLPSVVVEHRAASFRAALSNALAGVERAVRRTVQRRRRRPIAAAARKARASRRVH
jgi:ribosome-associated translation inhibitor RaiA